MALLPLVVALAIGQGGVSSQNGATNHPLAQLMVQDLGEPVQIDDVEVVGRRGAALTPPEIELDGADIDALAVWDIDEVLRRMEETLSLGGRPMVLINGQPTPNLGAYTGFPPDALVRAEVLPPEATALYGAAPGQRVVNLVLQPQFASNDGRLIGSRPTQGGASSSSGDVRRSAIGGRNTHQAGLRVSRDTALRAGERDHYRPAESPDADLVTLRPRSDSMSVTLNATRAFGEWSGVFSLNGQAQESHSRVRFGDGDVESHRESDSLTASAGFSGRVAGWFVQTNLNGRALRSREIGLQDMQHDTQSIGLNGSAQRPVFDLPSGPVTANLSANVMGSRAVVDRGQESLTSSFRNEDARGSLAIPLSKTGGPSLVGAAVGDLTAMFGGGFRQSGGGRGEDLNAGLSWTPRRSVRLNGEWSASSESVSDALRSEPQYYGPPVVVFDFRTGEAIEVLPIRGGSPDLKPPQSERLSLTASLGPFTSWRLAGNLGYQRAASTDGIGILPELTEDVEAAFPDRVRRDADGRLISIDYRPMNLSSTLVESLNIGLNFNLPRPARASGQEATILRVAFSHSFQIANMVRLRAGLPELDRLEGDGGGVSRQNARIMVDARHGRWGVNASAQWQEGYRTRRTGGRDGPDDLIIAPFTTMDMRFSFQMTSGGRNAEAEGPKSSGRRSAGLQVNFDIENLFDTRREARLGDGSPAPGYGRDTQDPMGRTVRLTLQRRF